jgi:hypothetical protein
MYISLCPTAFIFLSYKSSDANKGVVYILGIQDCGIGLSKEIMPNLVRKCHAG